MRLIQAISNGNALPMGCLWFDPTNWRGIIFVEDARGATTDQLEPLFDVTSASAEAWTNPHAVSGAFNLSETYDYYRERFARNSYNNRGSNLVGIVRIGNYPNASWNSVLNIMLFGEADNYAASLDVVAHEVTHGVIRSQGALDYENQSGALNEAYADIFGEMAEARSRGTNDWLIGSELNQRIRNMADPRSYDQPASMSQFVLTTGDQGGVHSNSGIINHAYYLLATGLRGSIGLREAERIFYRSLTTYLKPRSQFVDARLACITAAEDLFGPQSVQALLTAEAFDAVEIYAMSASAEQPSTVNAAVEAADSLIFIQDEEYWDWGSFEWRTRTFLGRRELDMGDPVTGEHLVQNVSLARPAISGDGSACLFVASNEDLGLLTTSTGVLTNFNVAGMAHSVASSPDGRYFAFVFNAVPGIPTNQIWLHDGQADTTVPIHLKTPVIDGDPVDNVMYADALSFSPDGRTLIYDALSRQRTPDGQFRSSWSIYALDTSTHEQRVIVPPHEEFQIGNPTFARTSSRFIVFDAEYTDGRTAIVSLDLYHGKIGLLGITANGSGFPCFNGDDSYVLFADQDVSADSGRSIYKQELSQDRLSTNGTRSLWFRNAKMAVNYRRGTYSSVNTAPAVTLVSPADGAVFRAPATVTLAASVVDDAAISRVEFYSGSTLLSTVWTPPYSFSRTNLPAGMHRVHARAYDDQGASGTSKTILWTVMPPEGMAVMGKGAAPLFQLSMRVPEPGLYRLDASVNLVDWIPLGSFYCSDNLAFSDASSTNRPIRFYRAVATPAPRTDPRSACIYNLRQIDGAKAQWALETGQANGATVGGAEEAEINAYLKGNTRPICPVGGAYRYNNVGSIPSCSVAGHTL